MITQERLRELLDYDADTGVFLWKKATSNRAPVGSRAGAVCRQRGYVLIRIDRTLYLAHRLAWFYVTGQWPSVQIDHKNTIRSDNSWLNLREATQVQNSGNMKMRSRNTSGFKGVTHWRGKWLAQIQANGKHHNLGAFKTPEAAHAAYVAKARELFGEFARAS